MAGLGAMFMAQIVMHTKWGSSVYKVDCPFKRSCTVGFWMQTLPLTLSISCTFRISVQLSAHKFVGGLRRGFCRGVILGPQLSSHVAFSLLCH